VTAVTSEKSGPSKRKAANNRRSYHEAQVMAGRSERVRLWKAAAWIVAEAKHRPDDEIDDLTNRLLAIAVELNGRSRK
jgi:hypothetical protein